MAGLPDYCVVWVCVCVCMCHRFIAMRDVGGATNQRLALHIFILCLFYTLYSLLLSRLFVDCAMRCLLLFVIAAVVVNTSTIYCYILAYAAVVVVTVIVAVIAVVVPVTIVIVVATVVIQRYCYSCVVT